ncbi:hypothetical protein [Streptococcus merionis]|uniref:Tetratricopeptide repeat protein n=1 Tax=Streptococcus merionis TaxID=400065 RepID=A0A239T0U1_9STRE|nr:hypothetical protein [Streptococcus merionis]QBX08775.1 hypothetical protein JavanS294_0016 [Streptococcus satellite phage Javan294]SNU90574.1 Uncharacterised protein [Streptococcus merionis]
MEKGFLHQQKGLQAYSDKNFSLAEKELNTAISLGFVSPGAVRKLATLYRKQKEYNKEVKLLELAIVEIPKSKEFHKTDLSYFRDRLLKARKLLKI